MHDHDAGLSFGDGEPGFDAVGHGERVAPAGAAHDVHSTGRHAAAVVVNMDLPWNPAVLEQRIGRVHRMGQSRGVRCSADQVLITGGAQQALDWLARLLDWIPGQIGSNLTVDALAAQARALT